MNNIPLGHFGEQIAVQYLTEKGYKILDTNFYTKFGEIDLICECQGVIIFVEVKTRTNKQFGNPEGSVNKKKIENLISVAKQYMINKNQSWQIDVVSVLLKDGDADIDHFPNCIVQN